MAVQQQSAASFEVGQTKVEKIIRSLIFFFFEISFKEFRINAETLVLSENIDRCENLCWMVLFLPGK